MLMLEVSLLLLLLLLHSAAAAATWPACPLPSVQGAAAGSSSSSSSSSTLLLVQEPAACSLSFSSTAAAAADSASQQQQVAVVVVRGVQYSSWGRPAAVELLSAQVGGSDGAAAAGEVALSPGSVLYLQDLLLLNASLADPNRGNPSTAFLPTSLQLPPGGLLKLCDVVMVVAPDTLTAYVAFLRSVPAATLFTDNTTFLHLRNFSYSPFAAVEARSLTLVAPGAASVRGMPLGLLLPFVGGSSSSSSGCSAEFVRRVAQQQRADEATVAAACGDATAGVITATDSYVLGASNATLLAHMQQLAGGGADAASRQPLLVLLASNVSVHSRAWGRAWPAGGVVLQRPVAWVGSSSLATSLDFGMQVGQVVLSGPWANLTLLNAVLENLPYGNAQSLSEAEGNSILLSNRLWPFSYKRSEPRLVLHDVVLVIPEQSQIDGVIYWVNAFNSELEFWRNRTTFLRDTMRYTVIKYALGSQPGDYIIIMALSKDQLVWNVTYTTRPVVAPPLPLPFNASLHQRLQAGQADPQIGAVGNVQDLVLTLWNQRSSACSRLHVLLPNQLLSLAPTSLSLQQQQVQPAAAGAAAAVSGSSSSDSSGSALSVTPAPLSELGLHAGEQNVTVLLPNARVATPAAASNPATGTASQQAVSQQWPPAGGEPVDCPAEIRGMRGTQQQTLVDVGFARDLFAASGPKLQQTDAATVGAGASEAASLATTGGVLRFSDVRLTRLPQGLSNNASSSSGSSSEQVLMQRAEGAWTSLLPAGAYTHLLWFVKRDLLAASGPSLLLANVTLVLPPPEAAQLAEMAAEIYAAAAASQQPEATGGSRGATFTVLFPTDAGPLTVVYRNLSWGPLPAAPAPSPTAANGRRRMLQEPAATAAMQPQPADSPPAGTMLCLGSMDGVGISGSNVCMTAQQPHQPLPPGYSWPSSSSSSSSTGLAGWGIALIVLAAAAVLLAACAALWGLFKRRRRAKSKGGQTQTQAAAKASMQSAAGRWMGVGQQQQKGSGDGGGGRSGDGGSKGPEKEGLTTPNVSGSSSRRIGAGSTGGGGAGGPGSSGAPCGSTDHSSSSTFSRLQAAALTRLQECCSKGGSGSSTAADDSTDGEAAAADAAARQLAGGQQLSAAAAAAADLVVVARSGGSVIVSLGDELGQLAAAHMASLEDDDEDGGPGSNDAPPRQQQQQRQPQGFGSFTQLGLAAASAQHQQQQQRSDKAAPFSGLSRAQRRPPSGSGFTGLSAGPAAAAGAAASLPPPEDVANGDEQGTILLSPAQHQQFQQQLRQQQQQQMQGATRISSAISTVTADIHIQRISRSHAALTATGSISPRLHSPRGSVTDGQTAAGGEQLTRGRTHRPSSSRQLQQQQQQGPEIQPAGSDECRRAARISSGGGSSSSGNDQPGNQPQAGLARVSRPQQQQQQHDLQRSVSYASGRGGGAQGSDGSAGGPGSGVTGVRQLQLLEVIGSGSFGVVYRAMWRGIPAAVKVMSLPLSLEEEEEPLPPASAAAAGGRRAQQGGGTGIAAAAVAERRRRGRGINRREQMAVMEAALGSSLSHPNILQVYTYLLRPLTAPGRQRSLQHDTATAAATANQLAGSSTSGSSAQELRGPAVSSDLASGSRQGSGGGEAIIGYELQLVMELCPLGSLRAAIDAGLLEDRLSRRPNYLTVLSLALGVAHAMNHLHSEGIVHGDLKAGNVLLKAELQPTAAAAAAAASGGGTGGGIAASSSSATGMLAATTGAAAGGLSGLGGPSVGGVQYQEQLVAKVADFGLACRLRDQDTHVSGVHRGTLNHMSPELLLHGHASPASDTYAFGVLLWEMATGLRALADIPKALVGAAIVRDRARPEWPDGSGSMNAVVAAAAAAAAGGGGGGGSGGCVVAAHETVPPAAYRELAAACWAHEASDRPSFDSICATLEELLAQEHARQARLLALCSSQQPSTSTSSGSSLRGASAGQLLPAQQQQQGVAGAGGSGVRATAAAAAAAAPLAASRVPTSVAGPPAAAPPGGSSVASPLTRPLSPFAAAAAEPLQQSSGSVRAGRSFWAAAGRAGSKQAGSQRQSQQQP